MNFKHSKEIYAQLIIGKHINKDTIDKANYKLIDNPLFKEIEIHIDQYREVYESFGYELIKEDNSFFYLLKEEESKDESYVDKGQLKEYLLTLLMIRYFIENKKPIKNLTELDKGISEKEFQEILQYEKFKDYILAFELKSDNVFHHYLVQKNILEPNERKNYVLTNVGRFFLDKLVKEINEEISEDNSENN